MKTPKLSNTLQEELKSHSKNDRKRRIIANLFVFLTILIFVVLAKVFIFKGDIKISEDQKSPSEKIETRPNLNNDETKAAPEQATAPPAATPTTPAPTSAPAETGYTAYVVKEGDTLSAIATAYKVKPGVIIEANKLQNPDTLLKGQKLFIPQP